MSEQVPWKQQERPAVNRRERSYAKAQLEQALEDPLQHAYERSIDPLTQTRLERFAVEYMKDYNPTKACLRMGFNQNYAPNLGREFLTHSYTQWFLRKRLDKLEAKMVVTRNEVLAGLKQQAEQAEKASDRIAAWSRIGDFLGMKQVNVKHTGNVQHVMALPMASSVEEWEQHSATAQSRLKESVRN